MWEVDEEVGISGSCIPTQRLLVTCGMMWYEAREGMMQFL